MSFILYYTGSASAHGNETFPDLEIFSRHDATVCYPSSCWGAVVLLWFHAI